MSLTEEQQIDLAAAYLQRRDAMAVELERLSLVVQVEPDIGQGLILRSDMDGDTAACNAAAEVLEGLTRALEAGDTAGMYRAFVDFRTVTACKGLPDGGLNLYGPIVLDGKSQDQLQAHQKLVHSFQLKAGPQPPREDIVMGDILGGGPKTWTSAQAELDFTCSTVVRAIVNIQQQRLIEAERTGFTGFVHNLADRASALVQGKPESWVLELCDNALTMVGDLQDRNDRAKLFEILTELMIVDR